MGFMKNKVFLMHIYKANTNIPQKYETWDCIPWKEWCNYDQGLDLFPKGFGKPASMQVV